MQTKLPIKIVSKLGGVLFAQADGYCMGFGGKPGHRENGDVVKTHAAFHACCAVDDTIEVSGSNPLPAGG